ncbi:hypothetical protein D9757_001458 [Collybiopsis confluens]|uniref:F-box domain-containing protein n=1 Tax=Collybiopsis confluens TaxID=2823264 RepID=A0A8H5HZ45_9AGAR|nr:hypothetical protein D9757_001458 [Collybiopsis confluens]
MFFVIWSLISLYSIFYTLRSFLLDLLKARSQEATTQLNTQSIRRFSGLLPLPTQNLILRGLSPLDRHRYSLVCKQAHYAVTSFNQQAYRIEHILSPYFSQKQIDIFRLIQLRTGTLISGSAALQFFDLSVFEDSDLDLYILRDWDKVMQLAGFLVSVSYDFHARPDQPRTFQDAYEAERNFEGFEPEYSTKGIWDVYSFVRQSDSRKIQIITCRKSIMHVILEFHSTCVMNVISYNHAYALFPYTTFVDRRTVALPRSRNSGFQRNVTAQAFKKYTDRGWRTSFVPSKANILRYKSEFRDTPRFVDDSSCWTISLAPVQHARSLGDFDVISPPLDLLRANSWYTILTSAGQTQIGVKVVTAVLDVNNAAVEESFTFPSVPHNLKTTYSAHLLGENSESFVTKRTIEDVIQHTHEKFEREPDAIHEYARELVAQAFASMPVFLNLEGKRLSPSAYSLGLLVRQLEITFNMFRRDPPCSITFRVDSTGHVWSYVVIRLPQNYPRPLLSALRNSADDFVLKHLMQHRVWITFLDGTQEVDLWGASIIRSADSMADSMARYIIES